MYGSGGGVRYVQCKVCGRVTPTDRGICYVCGAPLPGTVELPPGLVVCPNCLKVTSVETGYCRHCRAPLPRELVEEARARARRARLTRLSLRVGRVYRVGVI